MIHFFLTQGTVGLEVGRVGGGEWQLRRPALLGFQVPRSGMDGLRRNTEGCRVSAPLLIGHPGRSRLHQHREEAGGSMT